MFWKSCHTSYIKLRRCQIAEIRSSMQFNGNLVSQSKNTTDKWDLSKGLNYKFFIGDEELWCTDSLWCLCSGDANGQYE